MLITKRKRIAIALFIIAVIMLAVFCLTFSRSCPTSILPADLVNCCGIIKYKTDQVGMGIFVTTKMDRTNTYFVTALHCLTEIRSNENTRCFDLHISVRKRGGKGSAEILVPCNGSTVKLFGWMDYPLDLVAIEMRDDALTAPDVDVSPIVFDASLDMGEAHKKMRQKKPTTLCDKPGFLLYSSRERMNFAVGTEVFTLVSQKIMEADFESEIFPVFMRKGIVSFVDEARSYECIPKSERYHNTFLIDCQSAKSNSGSPVFLLPKATGPKGDPDGAPQLLGILLAVLKAKEDPQKLTLPLNVDGKKFGDVVGDQILDENTGLSLVLPVDYLAQMLILCVQGK